MIPDSFSGYLAVLKKRNSQNVLAFQTAPFYLVIAVCSSLYDRVITISFSISLLEKSYLKIKEKLKLIVFDDDII